MFEDYLATSIKKKKGFLKNETVQFNINQRQKGETKQKEKKKKNRKKSRKKTK